MFNTVTFSLAFNHFQEVIELWKVILSIEKFYVSNDTSNHTHAHQLIKPERGFLQVQVLYIPLSTKESD